MLRAATVRQPTRRRWVVATVVGVASLALSLLDGSAPFGIPQVGPADTRVAARPAAAAPAEHDGTRLMDEITFYPRAIRLAHSGTANGRVLVSVVTDTPSHTGVIFESTDEGESFQEVGRIADPWGAPPRGGCCSSIFELPRPIGAMPAGTLLWASSMGRNAGEARIRLWRSNDVGRTWSHVSSPFVAPNDLGVWEPELSIDTAGRLVLHFADETEQPARSQILARVVSDDGVTWSAKTPTVRSDVGHHRPGMPVVAELPNGSYVMTYEICALAAPYHCDVRIRHSADGWNWGDPADLGERPTTVDGNYFTHTPTIAWSPGDSDEGRVLLIGQILQERSGAVADGNGATAFVNTENARGYWYEIPAPVEVPDARDAVCPNYSSTLLPSPDGSRLLEVATDEPPGEQTCAGYVDSGSAVGAGPVAKLPRDRHGLVNVGSAHCLDVAGGSSEPNANIAQWLCNEQAPQDFRPVGNAGGTFRIEASISGHCVDVSGPVEAGADVRQQVCSDAPSQRWRFVDAGRGYYRVTDQSGGYCLEVAGGSEAPGADVIVGSCVDRSRQTWRLERRP
jgi:Ricin-type beta-trefoil lectin domain-like